MEVSKTCLDLLEATLLANLIRVFLKLLDRSLDKLRAMLAVGHHNRARVGRVRERFDEWLKGGPRKTSSQILDVRVTLSPD